MPFCNGKFNDLYFLEQSVVSRVELRQTEKNKLIVDIKKLLKKCEKQWKQKDDMILMAIFLKFCIP